MQIWHGLFLTFAAVTSCSTAKTVYVYAGAETEAPNEMEPNYQPTQGYVQKPEVAAKIAEAVAQEIYGKTEISDQKPYRVTKNGDQWIVRGTMPKKYDFGGVFEVRISSMDGRIVRVIHSE